LKLEKVLKLGNPVLYQKSSPVQKEELNSLLPVIQDLHDILFEFRAIHNAGRAVAAPQIGAMKRLIYMNSDGKSSVIINPVLENLSDEMFEVWDDCLCFPNLLVKVKRHKSCTLKFTDENWNEQIWNLTGSLSELIQHECDHLDGILATQKAIDDKSFRMK
jgi:peptide deformylase